MMKRRFTLLLAMILALSALAMIPTFAQEPGIEVDDEAPFNAGGLENCQRASSVGAGFVCLQTAPLEEGETGEEITSQEVTTEDGTGTQITERDVTGAGEERESTTIVTTDDGRQIVEETEDDNVETATGTQLRQQSTTRTESNPDGSQTTTEVTTTSESAGQVSLSKERVQRTRTEITTDDGATTITETRTRKVFDPNAGDDELAEDGDDGVVAQTTEQKTITINPDGTRTATVNITTTRKTATGAGVEEVATENLTGDVQEEEITEAETVAGVSANVPKQREIITATGTRDGRNVQVTIQRESGSTELPDGTEVEVEEEAETEVDADTGVATETTNERRRVKRPDGTVVEQRARRQVQRDAAGNVVSRNEVVSETTVNPDGSAQRNVTVAVEDPDLGVSLPESNLNFTVNPDGSVSGSPISATVGGQSVTIDPTSLTEADLALFLEDPASFAAGEVVESITVSGPNTFELTGAAQSGSYAATVAPADAPTGAIVWSFSEADGAASGLAATVSFDAPGTYTITARIGRQSGSVNVTVTGTGPDTD